VTLKIALDRTGAVDDLAGKAERFTSPKSLDAVHRLRRDSDAVLVGVGTVERDDPGLTVRRVGFGRRQPLRVVLDPKLRSPPGCALLNDGLASTVVFADAEREISDLWAALQGKTDVDVEKLVDLPQMLSTLERRYAVSKIMVEGGPETARRMLDARLVDRAVIIRAPVTFKEPVPSQIDAARLAAAGLSLVGVRQWEADEVEMWCRKPTLETWAKLEGKCAAPPGGTLLKW